MSLGEDGLSREAAVVLSLLAVFVTVVLFQRLFLNGGGGGGGDGGGVAKSAADAAAPGAKSDGDVDEKQGNREVEEDTRPLLWFDEVGGTARRPSLQLASFPVPSPRLTLITLSPPPVCSTGDAPQHAHRRWQGRQPRRAHAGWLPRSQRLLRHQGLFPAPDCAPRGAPRGRRLVGAYSLARSLTRLCCVALR